MKEAELVERRPYERRAAEPQPTSWHGHPGHDCARAGRPCYSGRDAHATFTRGHPGHDLTRAG